MKRYETYKPSGVEWLGEIPKDWEVKRVKDCAQICNGKSQAEVNTDDDSKYPIYGSGGIMGYATDFIYKKPSLLLGRKGTINKPLYVLNPFWTIDTMFYTKINKKNIFDKFLYYMSLIFPFQALSTNTALPSMTQQSLSLCPISYPNLAEQTTIANYLDTKTTAIDRKIEVLTAKSNKYKALRRSLINETVCRGLNPNVPQKDSGIEWIGMIPEHWEGKRFKDIAYSITGLTYSPDDIVDEGEGVLVLRSGNIQNGELSFNDNVFVNSNIGKNLFVRKGDILLCSRNGSANLVGKSAFIDNSYNYTWGAFMIVVRSKMGRFLFYALNSDLFKRNMGLFQTSTVNQLTSKMLDNMAFIVPTKEEQKEIVDYLDTKSTQIDTILKNISEQINKLTQLRKTLINDVVTGKIKVTE